MASIMIAILLWLNLIVPNNTYYESTLVNCVNQNQFQINTIQADTNAVNLIWSAQQYNISTITVIDDIDW